MIYDKEFYEKATDEQLTRWISERKRAVEGLDKDRQTQIDVINEYQAELERRALAAYWEDHTGMPIYPGDKLLVNSEVSQYLFGKELEVKPFWSWELNHLQHLVCVSSGIIELVPMEWAQEWRAAYLAKYPESEANS